MLIHYPSRRTYKRIFAASTISVVALVDVYTGKKYLNITEGDFQKLKEQLPSCCRNTLKIVKHPPAEEDLIKTVLSF